METICISGQDYTIYNIRQLEKSAKINISRLPFSISILVENLLRKQDGEIVWEADRLAIVGDKQWEKNMATFIKPFTTATVKYFDLGEFDAANAWISE